MLGTWLVLPAECCLCMRNLWGKVDPKSGKMMQACTVCDCVDAPKY